MKKRILSAILVSALVLSMAGCNGDTPTSEPVSQQSQTSTSENKEQSSSTSEAVSSESTSSESTSASSSSENTSTSTNSESIPSASSSSENNPSSSSSSSSKPVSSSSTTSTKPVVPTNQPSIVDFYYEDYSNTREDWSNIWHFVTSDKQHYAYNLAEKKIYKLDIRTDISAVRTMGQLVYYYNPAGYNTYIQNASTQQTVLPSSEGYRIEGFYWALDRILVTKVEKGFSGNKLLIGVMNSKMEWVYPLTEISFNFLYCKFYLLGDKIMIYGNRDTGIEHPYIYSFKNNSITPLSTYDWPNSNWNWNYTRDKILVSFYLESAGFWCFDSTSENGVFYDKYGELIRYTPSGNIVTKKNNKYYVLDDKTMKELDFDLSAYNVQFIIDSTKDRIMFTAFNPNGDAYTIIMNKDGSLVTEPILGDQGISFCDDNAILKNNTIINCKTGQTTKVDYEIKQVYSAYGMMVVYSGKNYYLVKPSEPNKLLSPFAIGQRV